MDFFFKFLLKVWSLYFKLHYAVSQLNKVCFVFNFHIYVVPDSALRQKQWRGTVNYVIPLIFCGAVFPIEEDVALHFRKNFVLLFPSFNSIE